MHLCGGIAATLFIFWLSLFTTSRKNVFLSKTYLLTLSLLGSFSIGVLWEIFEYRFGITSPAFSNYRFETFKDLAMVVVGGMSVFILFLIFRNRGKAKIFISE